MSTLLNDDSLLYILPTLLQRHFRELDLNPEELLLKEEKGIAIIAKRLSLSRHEEPVSVAVGVGFSAEKTDPTNWGKPNFTPAGGGPVDSAFYNDYVAQATVANNKFFTRIAHGYLIEAGKDEGAELYLKKVTPVSLVQNLESIKVWNYETLVFRVLKGLEEMGLGENPLSFVPPPHHVPIPEPGWKPNQAACGNNSPGPCVAGLTETFATDEVVNAGEIEQGNPAAVEANPGEVVLLIGDEGEGAAETMMDAPPASCSHRYFSSKLQNEG